MKNKPVALRPTDEQLAAIERVIGYPFRDITLLRQAFTRRSYTKEYEAKNKRPAPVECNELLETLGDSMLSAALLTILFRRHGKVTGRGYESDFGEGVFTEIKKNLCDKTALSRIIDGLKTEDGVPFALLQEVSDGDRSSGNCNAPSPKEDLFESIVGAVALDSGCDLAAVIALVERLDDPDRLTVALPEKDAVTRLKELCEAKKWTLDYPEIGQTGPDHDPTFTVECRINGELVCTGSGKSKKAAKSDAAKAALEKMGS